MNYRDERKKERAAVQAEHLASVLAQGCVDPGFGRPYGSNHYVTPRGREVWMWRKGQRVRWFDRHGVQVGPEQANVAPALLYAASKGWKNPRHPAWLSEGLIRETRASAKKNKNRRSR